MSKVAEANQHPGALALDKIKVVSNVRKHFDEKALSELTENVKKVGILQPILVRKNGAPGVYELIAGERRLRAARAAGLEQIPVKIMDVTEAEALEIQAFENLHRKDLGPIEEARAFKALLDGGNYDVAALAGRVDKSETYVYRAVRLLELPEALIEAIETGTLTAAHGHQVLRVPEDQREEAAEKALEKDWRHGVKTAQDLARAIEQMGAWLDHAPFPKNEEIGGKPACTACPYNSGNQGTLFDGAEKGRCLMRSCFNEKLSAVTQSVRSKATAKFKNLEDLGVHEVTTWSRKVKGMPKAALLDDAALKASKDLIKKQPEKFGIVISPATSHEKPAFYVVAKDAAILPKKMRPERESPGSDTPKKTEREKFIEKAEQTAVLNACFDQSACLDKKILKVIAERMTNWLDAPVGPDDIYKAKGVRYPIGDKNASREELVRLAFMVAVMDWHGADEDAASDAGINVEKVKAAARKAAVAEFDAKAKEAPAKSKKS